MVAVSLGGRVSRGRAARLTQLCVVALQPLSTTPLTTDLWYSFGTHLLILAPFLQRSLMNTGSQTAIKVPPVTGMTTQGVLCSQSKIVCPSL